MPWNYLKELLACGESDEGRENQEIPAAELQDFAIRNQKSGEFAAETDFKAANYLFSVTLMKANKQTVFFFHLRDTSSKSFRSRNFAFQFGNLLNCYI